MQIDNQTLAKLKECFTLMTEQEDIFSIPTSNKIEPFRDTSLGFAMRLLHIVKSERILLDVVLGKVVLIEVTVPNVSYKTAYLGIDGLYASHHRQNWFKCQRDVMGQAFRDIHGSGTSYRRLNRFLTLFRVIQFQRRLHQT